MTKVMILATCRKPELLPYTLLVFKTIRVGFPTADVQVYLNGRVEESTSGLINIAAGAVGATIHILEEQVQHHEWIKGLCSTQKEPFWICDTDIIFYDKVEELSSTRSLFGWRIPQWLDEFTGCVTRSRIHTCLMRIDPVLLAEDINKYMDKFNRISWINPDARLFAPITIPVDGVPHFYDVSSVLFHAVGGESFQDQIKDTFFHFNFGTISDVVLPKLKDGERMRVARDQVLNNPELGRGMWRLQEEYYESRKIDKAGSAIIEPISDEDADKARLWCIELCRGNQDAIVFCDQWHFYCHGIDDLIDTMQDGRPIMCRDQIIRLFMRAAILYNCTFFVANRTLLFPIVLDITNIYTVSVQWEKSSRAHLRKMADVFRTCGNRMYSMVALICGGEQHMLEMTLKITERDYLSQHDANDQPL